jgi:hypothetical protein
MSQFLGTDAANAEQDAITRQQESAAQTKQQMLDKFNELFGLSKQNISDYSTQVGKEASYLEGLNTDVGGFYDEMANKTRDEFSGALKDVYAQGRNQAASSGLIGGFQEGQNTAPAIAALGRSYATTQAGIAQQAATQKANTRFGIGQMVSNLRLSPYAMSNNLYGGLAGTFSGLYGQAGQSEIAAKGNYSAGANPLGNIIGAVGGLAGGIGSFMSGGAAAGLWGAKKPAAGVA